MHCPCGGTTKYEEHEVKTLEKAQEWYLDITDECLPILVRRDVCTSCGRQLKYPPKQVNEY